MASLLCWKYLRRRSSGDSTPFLKVKYFLDCLELNSVRIRVRVWIFCASRRDGEHVCEEAEDHRRRSGDSLSQDSAPEARPVPAEGVSSFPSLRIAVQFVLDLLSFRHCLLSLRGLRFNFCSSCLSIVIFTDYFRSKSMFSWLVMLIASSYY